jgi:tetratricopeptide (TPR) repeat protein
MKKVVLASLLAVAASAATMVQPCFAQDASAPAAGQAGGQVQMSADEYKVYNDAATATTPAAQAAGFEAYLKAYPNSAVKKDALQQLMFAYSKTNDPAKTLDAADRLLQVDPKNLTALTFETFLRRTAADAVTDPAAKTAALDKAAGYAQTGLSAGKPSGMDDATFKTAMTTFESAIADDDISKKDYAGAVTALKTEVTDAPAEATQTPGPVLQDVFFLATSYMNSTPPDYLNCAWYASRAAAFAGQFASQIQPTATYCYKKYHGNADGYDKLQALVKTSLTPPTDLGTTITAAPKPADIVANLIATTPDLATLALSDKEYVLQNGKPEDADKVFTTIKGKVTQFPDTTVVAATADQLQVSVSDDAVQSKTADFAFNFTTPLKTVPAVGDKISLIGTYASYTQSPLLITMSDASVVEKKKPAAPVHHRATH